MTKLFPQSPAPSRAPIRCLSQAGGLHAGPHAAHAADHLRGWLVAAFTAANGEIHLTSTDTAQKKAYYAAEARIENYEYHLTQDGNYLTFCTRTRRRPTPL